jgi:AraC-like DNA-binding protein
MDKLTENRVFAGFLSSGYQCLSTTNREDAVNMASELITPIEVEFRTSRGRFFFEMAHRQIGNLSLSALHQESDKGYLTKMKPSRSTYTIEVPIYGNSVFKSRGERIAISADGNSVLSSPDEAVVVDDCGAAYGAVSLNINSQMIASKYLALTGSHLNTNLVFNPIVDTISEGGLELRRMILTLLNAAASERSIFTNNRAAAHFEELLAVCLLTGFEHSKSSVMTKTVEKVSEKTVNHVLDYIYEHFNEDIELETLAKISGSSVRSLQRSFQDVLGTTPTRRLKCIRLDHARTRLLRDGNSTSVTEIAYWAGFNHLGNFAADYRKRFGEYPSQTAKVDFCQLK